MATRADGYTIGQGVEISIWFLFLAWIDFFPSSSAYVLLKRAKYPTSDAREYQPNSANAHASCMRTVTSFPSAGLPDHPPMPMPKAAPNPPQQPPATANTRQTQTASQATTSSSKPAEPVRYPWEQRIWEHPDWWVVPKTEADALVVVRIDPRRHYAPKVSRKKKMPRLQVCKEKCSQAVTKVGGQLSAAWKRVVTPCMQSLQLGLVGRMPSIDGDMAVPKGKWYLMRGTIWRLLLKPVS